MINGLIQVQKSNETFTKKRKKINVIKFSHFQMASRLRVSERRQKKTSTKNAIFQMNVFPRI